MDKFRTGMPIPDMVRELNRLDSRQAGGLTAASSTSLSIATGQRVLEVGPDLQFVAGQPVRIASAGDPTGTYMDGIVTSYEGSTLAVNVDSLRGSGTGSAWVVTVTGAQGPQGGLTEADLDARVSAVTVAGNFVPVAATAAGHVAIWLEGGALAARGLSDDLRASTLAGAVDRVALSDPAIVPVAQAADGKVPIWLEDGDLAARGMAPGLRQQATKDVVTPVPLRDGLVPLVHDARGNIPLYLRDGKLDAAGVTDHFARQVFGAAQAEYAPINFPRGSRLPACTDGRTLFRWRAKVGDILAGRQTRAKIAFTGDSWTEAAIIPVAVRDALVRRYGFSGEGWQSARPVNKMNGVVMTQSGFTLVDGSDTSVFPYGAGPDGFNLYASGTTATYSLANLRATRLLIVYTDTTGTWRYRVDGGPWTSVTGAGTGASAVHAVEGLSDAAHLLEIDTTGNTGVVAHCGIYAESPNVPGVELNKMGNSGLRSSRLRAFIPYVEAPAAHLDLDLLVVILGTNDYRSADTPVSEYVETLASLFQAYRSATPDIGIIAIAPPDTNGNAVTPLVRYRDALYELCVDAGCEFYNAHDLMGTFAQEDALGQFQDDLHLNQRGAVNLGEDFVRRFFL